MTQPHTYVCSSLIKKPRGLFYFPPCYHFDSFGAPKLYHIILARVNGFCKKTTQINKIFLLTKLGRCDILEGLDNRGAIIIVAGAPNYIMVVRGRQ